MKKIFCIFIIFFFFFNISKADKLGLNSNLKLNNEIIYGKLDNGFTYYIKRNLKPKNKEKAIIIGYTP